MGKFKDLVIKEKFGGKTIDWFPERFGWFKWGIDEDAIRRGFAITKEQYENAEKASQGAQDYLSMLGVSKQRSYVVIRDLSNESNRNTGKAGDVAGYASNQYIAIGVNMLDDVKRLENTLIHEWAHRYFFNLSKEQKKSFGEVYKKIVLPKELDDDDVLQAIGADMEKIYTESDLYFFAPMIVETFEGALSAYHQSIYNKYPMVFEIDNLKKTYDNPVDIVRQLIYNTSFDDDVNGLSFISTFLDHGITLKQSIGDLPKGSTGSVMGLYYAIKKTDINPFDVFTDSETWFDINEKAAKEVVDELGYLPESGRDELYNPIGVIARLGKMELGIKDFNEEDADALWWDSMMHVEDINYLNTKLEEFGSGYSIEGAMEDMSLNAYLDAFKKHPALLWTLETFRIYISKANEYKNPENLEGGKYQHQRDIRAVRKTTPSSYSASNLDELWADGVTYFRKLDNKELRKEILRLLSK